MSNVMAKYCPYHGRGQPHARQGTTPRPEVTPGRTPVNSIGDVLSQVDFAPTNLSLGTKLIGLLVMEDNEAVIKIAIKGRANTMRHVARTHRIDLEWLIERSNSDPSLRM